MSAGGASDFWSRRKARVAEEAEAERAEADDAAARSARDALSEKTDEEILAELELPDPDALEAGDDFSGFLRSEVPERLRRRALRRLWRSNSVLANLDSLVEYGEDYTDSATVVENLQTAYRVGRGMVDWALKDEEPAPAEDPAPDAPAEEVGEDAAKAAGVAAAPEADQPPVEEVASGKERDPLGPTPEITEDEEQLAAGAMPQATPYPRRMKFSYSEPRHVREEV